MKYRKRIAAVIEEQDYERLVAIAERMDVPVSQLYRWAVRDWLKRQDEGAAA